MTYWPICAPGWKWIGKNRRSQPRYYSACHRLWKGRPTRDNSENGTEIRTFVQFKSGLMDVSSLLNLYKLWSYLSKIEKKVLGAVYKSLDEKMKMLWSADLLMNTVHVHDLVRGLWHLAHHGKVRISVFRWWMMAPCTYCQFCRIIDDLRVKENGFFAIHDLST